MRHLLRALVIAAAFQIFAAAPPASARTVQEIPNFPLQALRSGVGKKLYSSLAISPVSAWVSARAAVVTASGSEYWSMLVKASAILSVITVVELTRTAQNVMNITYRPVESFCVAAVLYFLMLFACSMFTRHLERRTEGARA